MALPDPERTRVVLWGTSQFADAESLPPLPAVAQNIEDLTELLTDPTYGIVPPSHCTILQDERSVPSIGRQIRAAAEQAEDLLLVYYSGHGLKDGRGHELYLATYDSDPREPALGSLRYNTLRGLVLDSPAKAKVIVLDCCFSGRALGEEMSEKSVSVLGQLEVEGCFLLTSSQGHSLSLSLPDEPNTAFTGRLLTALREGITEDEEYVSLDLLHGHLTRVMRRQGLHTPDKRGSRTVGQLAIAPNRAYSTVASATLGNRYASLVRRAAGGRWADLEVEATALCEEQSRILGDIDPQTLATQQFLCVARGASGDPAGAALELRRILDRHRPARADASDISRIRLLLAITLAGAGDHEEAVSLLRVLVPERRRVLGLEHPTVLRTQHLLARSLAALGQVTEAKALLREIVSIAAEQTDDAGTPLVADVEVDLLCLAAADPASR